MMAVFFKSNQQNLSALITLIIGLITITPLCGWMFDCGCTWPWTGLERHCNFYDESQSDQCPWCVSLILGCLFAGIPLLISSVFAWSGRYLLFCRSDDSPVSTTGVYDTGIAISINLILGLMMLLVLGLFSGWLAGEISDYPYFVLKCIKLF